jgi:DNA-binding response OmpR family regulator
VQQPTTVAVVNTNPDLVRLLLVNLEQAGFVVFVIHIEDIKLGMANVESFLHQHDPRVIVYDVAPPYELNWRTLEHMRTATNFHGRHFVLTTVNLDAVQRITRTEETVHEVVGEVTDIQAVVRAVRDASRARPTR